MAIEAREVTLYIRKVLIRSIRLSYRSVRNHPVVFSVGFLLLGLYISFPSLFAFLVSSSPVLVCTTFLLGALLSYGEPNIPEVEEEDNSAREISSLKVQGSTDDLCMKKDESFTGHSTEIDEAAIKEPLLGEERISAHIKGEEYAPLMRRLEKVDTPSTSISSDKDESEEVDVNDKVNGERELHLEEIGEMGEMGILSKEKAADGLLAVDEEFGGFIAADEKSADGLKMDINNSAANIQFDSSLGEALRQIDMAESSSDSESDTAESSSPDASMADIIPMLDELHPLLDFESAHPSMISKDNLDAASQVSSEDHEVDDDSVEEEVENHEAGEDKGAEGKNDDGSEAAVTWTEDDQKNLMDLGTSELERNRRLESLIAKRRARMRFQHENNLIDLDGNNSAPTTEELSHFRVQIPPISAPRKNPFDFSYDSDEISVPGSAPSVLLPRRNPFDIPYDQLNESNYLSRETWSPREYTPIPQQDMFFRRHESFNLGGGELKQEKRFSRLRPYFVPETMNSDEGSSAVYQRQFSDRSESKLSSVLESDTVSSVTDQDYHNDPVEEEFHQEHDSPSPSKYDVEYAEHQSQSSDDAGSMVVELGMSEISATDANAIHLHNMVMEETSEAFELSGSLDGKLGEETHSSPTNSYAGNSEILEQKHGDSIYPTLLEDFKEPSVMFDGQAHNSELAQKAMPPLLADPDLLSWEESVGDSQVADVILDSSREVTDKSIFNISAQNQVLHPTAKASHSAKSLLESNINMDFAVAHSSSMLVDKNGYSEIVDQVGEMASCDETIWVALSSQPSIKEHEPRSREIGEKDATEVGLPIIYQQFDDPVVSAISEEENMGLSQRSTSFPVESQSSSSTLDVSASRQAEGYDLVDLSHSDDSTLSRNCTSIGLGDSLISSMDLHPIPENSEDFKPQEHEIATHPDAAFCLTGLQINEEHHIIGSVIEQELSTFQGKSVVENSANDDTSRLNSKSEEGSSSVAAPVLPTHDDDFIQCKLLEPTETLNLSSSTVMKSEVVIKRDLTESREDINNVVQSKEEHSPPNYLNDSDEESHKVYPEQVEIKEIDENLLSEMDAVGDFHVEELRSDQQIPDLKLHGDGQYDAIASNLLSVSAFHDMATDLQHSQVSFDTSVNFSSEANLEQSEAGTSFGPSAGDPEQTVYNPRRHVLQASSVEEINALIKQLDDEEEQVSSVSLSTVDKLLVAKPELQSSELEFSESEGEQTVNYSRLLVLEAKSIEDRDLAFKQFGESLDKSSFPDIGPSYVTPGEMDLDPTDSDLHVVEAKSLDDIHAAFEQICGGIIDYPSKVKEGNDTERNLEPDNLEVQSAKEIDLASPHVITGESGSSSEMLFLEAKSIEDIDSSFKQVGESLDKSSSLDIGFSHVIPDEMELNWTGINSNLVVVEAKSLDDIDAALEQISGGIIDYPSKVTESKDGSGRADETERHPEPDDLEIQSDKEIEIASSQVITGESGSSEMLVAEAKSVEDIESAFKHFGESPDESFIPDIGPSHILPGEMDLNSTEINSNLVVVEAKSLDDIDAAFQQISSGKFNYHSKVMESEDESGRASDTERCLKPDDLEMQSPKETELPSKQVVTEESDFSVDMQVVEAKSVEDIDLAFKQYGEFIDKSSLLDIGSSHAIPGQMDFDAESSLQVVEAKSLDDIDAAFKHISGGVVDYSFQVTEPKDESGKPDETERHLEADVGEVQSAKEIDVASTEVVTRESTAILEQMDQRTDGDATMTAFSSSIVPTLQKTQKKKSNKSSSRSSSSSSSSDSD